MLTKIKALAKRLIPERYRLSRYLLWEKLRYYPELFFSLGTFEDPSAKSDADRIRLFGQKDHVRLYAEFDYLQRLGKTGFDVKIGKATDFGQETLTKYALIREEQIFVGTKYEGVQNQAS